jgi:hypothetical protein
MLQTADPKEQVHRVLHGTHRFQRMHVQVDAGLDSELVLGDPKAPRFVLWNNELLPTPSGPDVATFKLLSIWGKLRAGLGAAGFKQPMPGKASLAACWSHHIVLACAVTTDAAVPMHTASSGGWRQGRQGKVSAHGNPGALHGKRIAVGKVFVDCSHHRA